MYSKFINYNKWTIWSGILITGKAKHIEGQKVYGKSLYFSLRFVVNLKIHLRIKSFLKKSTYQAKLMISYSRCGGAEISGQDQNISFLSLTL